MKILQTITLTGLLAGYINNSTADTTLTFTDNNENVSMKMHIADNKLRASSIGDNSTYMIYDANNKTFTTFDATEKQYYIMGEKEIAALSDMNAMVEKLIEEQLGEMPEAQRAMMRGMMENMIKSQLPKEMPKPEYTLTGDSKSYNGYNCQIVSKKSKDDSAEFCVAKYDELGMKSDEYAVINSFQKTIESLAQKVGVDHSMDFSGLGDFIPVHYKQAGQTGSLSGVNHDDIDSSLFAIPEDYSLIELPFNL